MKLSIMVNNDRVVKALVLIISFVIFYGCSPSENRMVNSISKNNSPSSSLELTSKSISVVSVHRPKMRIEFGPPISAADFSTSFNQDHFTNSKDWQSIANKFEVFRFFIETLRIEFGSSPYDSTKLRNAINYFKTNNIKVGVESFARAGTRAPHANLAFCQGHHIAEHDWGYAHWKDGTKHLYNQGIYFLLKNGIAPTYINMDGPVAALVGIEGRDACRMPYQDALNSVVDYMITMRNLFTSFNKGRTLL